MTDREKREEQPTQKPSSSPNESQPAEPSAAQERTPPRSFRKKLENFFFHYKWHTAAVLVALAVTLVASLQMCQRPHYDYTVMYAGPHIVSSKEALSAAQSLGSLAEGKSCDYYSYYIDTKNATGFTGQNLEAFDQEIMSGNAPILLVSPELFTRLTEGNGALTELDKYLPAESGAVYYSGDRRAVLLSSLDISTLPGISALPQDTLLCMRSGVSMANIFSRKQAEKRFAEHEKFIELVFSYEKPEEPEPA